MTKAAEHNLLFGILAFQMDFVRRDQLVTATGSWLTDKSRRLQDILVEQGAIDEEDRQLLAPLVARHLENHGGNPLESLATLSGIESIADDLRSLDDESIDATLSLVAAAPSAPVTQATEHHFPEATASHRSVDGDTCGRFRILRSHAKGGLGEVYLAKDTELNREVALKEIQNQYADDESSRARFLLEAEVTGSLEHPGIVPVYGLGRYEDGRPFYAMRFVKGDSLQSAADQFHGRSRDTPHNHQDKSRTADFGSLEFRQLLGRFLDICQAIEYAHSRGVLHRDLKPGNIMLGKYGETLVVDWGLARTRERNNASSLVGETTLRPASGSGVTPTLMGSAIGTPAFMPPEQAEGNLERLGPASDVYSLGATLYYLITGQAPFRGKNGKEIIEQVKAGRVLPPQSIQDNVPKALSAICIKAMALKVDDRYASALRLSEDIERFLADEPVRAFREPMVLRARRWIRKHQTLSVATAAVFLVLGLGLGVHSAVVKNKNTALAELNGSLDRKNAELIVAKQQADAERDEKSRISAKLALDRARQLSQEGNVAVGLQWYLRAAELSPSEDFVFHDLIRANLGRWQGELIQLTNQVAVPWTAGVFARNGQAFYRGHSGIGIVSWNTQTGKVERVLTSPESNIDPNHYIGRLAEELNGSLPSAANFEVVAVSSDESILVVAQRGQIFVWRIDTQPVNVVRIGDQDNGSAVAIHPMKNLILIGTADGTLRMYDLNSGKPTRDLIEHGTLISKVLIDPDGNSMVTGGFDGILKRWEVETGLEIKPALPHSRAITAAAYSPDGKQIVVGCFGSLTVWDAKSSTKLMEQTLSGVVRDIAFSQEGDYFAIGCEGSPSVVWNTRTMTPVAHPIKHIQTVTRLAFGSDSSQLITHSPKGVVRTWKLPDPQASHINLDEFRGGRGFAISPDGRWVGLGNLRGEIRIQSLDHNDDQGTIDFGEPVATIAASPDSKFVFVGGFRGTGRVYGVADQESAPLSFASSGPIFDSSFLDDDRIAIGLMDKKIVIWNLQTGEIEEELADPGFQSLIRIGDSLASMGNQGTIRLWGSLKDQDDDRTIETNARFKQIASSRDGRYIAACGETGIMVWTATGDPVVEIDGGEYTKDIDFGNDGRCLASSSMNGAIRLWHLPTGKLLGPVANFQDTGPIGFDGQNRLVASVVSDEYTVSESPPHSLYIRENPTPLVDDFEVLREWLQLQTGIELDDQGIERTISVDEWSRMSQQLGNVPVEFAL